jgi:hypothetical protein
MVLTVAELRNIIRNYKKAQFPQALSTMKRADLIILAFTHKLIENHQVSKKDLELFAAATALKSKVVEPLLKVLAPAVKPKTQPLTESEVIQMFVPNVERTPSKDNDFKRLVLENVEKRDLLKSVSNSFTKNEFPAFIKIVYPFMAEPFAEFRRRLLEISKQIHSKLSD